MRGGTHASDLHWSGAGRDRLLRRGTYSRREGMWGLRHGVSSTASQIVMLRARARALSGPAGGRGLVGPRGPDRLSAMADFDVVVLGAGPGGYVAAIRASQLGKKVAVVEKQYWGGVCLNVGCIPSKALLKNAELAHTLTHDKKKFGIEGDATMAFGPTHARSRQVSDGIVKGVHFLMKKNKIEEIDGWGTLTSPPRWTSRSTTARRAHDHLRQPHHRAPAPSTRMLPGVEVARTSSPTRSRSSTPSCPARSSSPAPAPSASSSPTS